MPRDEKKLSDLLGEEPKVPETSLAQKGLEALVAIIALSLMGGIVCLTLAFFAGLGWRLGSGG